jgi:hypothetical protein
MLIIPVRLAGFDRFFLFKGLKGRHTFNGVAAFYCCCLPFENVNVKILFNPQIKTLQMWITFTFCVFS